MKNHTIAKIILVLSTCSFLTGCSTDAPDQISGVGLMSGDSKNDDKSNQKGGIPVAVDCGLTPVVPTMENLKGKPQEFPAKYPLVRYPNSTVKFVRIEKMLYPGWKNQVMLNSTDTQYRIAGFYKDKLAHEGWQQVYQFENSAYSSTIWQKDGQEVEVRVVPDLYRNENIQLLYGPAEKRKKYVAQLVLVVTEDQYLTGIVDIHQSFAVAGTTYYGVASPVGQRAVLDFAANNIKAGSAASGCRIGNVAYRWKLIQPGKWIDGANLRRRLSLNAPAKVGSERVVNSQRISIATVIRSIILRSHLHQAHVVAHLLVTLNRLLLLPRRSSGGAAGDGKQQHNNRSRKDSCLSKFERRNIQQSLPCIGKIQPLDHLYTD